MSNLTSRPLDYVVRAPVPDLRVDYYFVTSTLAVQEIRVRGQLAKVEFVSLSPSGLDLPPSSAAAKRQREDDDGEALARRPLKKRKCGDGKVKPFKKRRL